MTRAGGSAGAASVAYATGNGTATAGSDYTATSGILGFADGEAGTKTFTIPILDDVVAEGNETVNLSLSSATGASLGSASTAVLTIVDDDAPGVTVTPTTGLVTTESGGTATFTVRLNSQPTASVTIGLNSANPPEGTVDRNSLVFTPANWNVPQAVTVRGVPDQVVDGDVAYAIITGTAQSADAGYNGLNPADVAATNVNADVAGFAVTPTSGLVTTELGGTASFTVRLTSRPAAPVTVGVASTNPGEVVPSLTSLVFTPANWNAPQTVLVTGQADHVIDPDRAVAIVLSAATSADPAYNGFKPADIGVTNLNADAPGASVTPIGPPVTTEAGGTARFSVQLPNRPAADVAITFASSNPAEGIVTTPSLVFTPTNWNTPQVLVVAGADDSRADGSVVYAVTGTAAIADPFYNNLRLSPVAVVNADDDTAGFTPSTTGGLVTTEAGGTATFFLRLNTQPTADVTIPFRSSNPAEGSVTTPSATFTPTNWNVAQAVTVAGVDDFVADGNVAYTVDAGAVVSGDPAYAGIRPPSDGVTNVDDDVAGIAVTPTSPPTTTAAGGSATFAVALRSRPRTPVAVTLASTDPGQGTVATPTLIFTPDNWNVPQSATVVGSGRGGRIGSIPYAVAATATSQDDAYNNLTGPSIALTNVNPPAVPVVGVQVVTVKVGKTRTQAIAVNFGAAIDPAAAANPANYQLVGAGRDGKLGTRDDVRLGLAAATYDPASGSVRLAPGKKVALSAAPVQLRVVAAGLLDAAGRPVDGNRDGLPGGDAVATIRKKRVTLS